MKKLTLILCFLLFISGCTKTVTIIEMPVLPEFPTTEMIPFKDPTGKVVTQSDTNPYWITNNVGYNYENNETINSEKLSIQVQSIRILGLLDKTIESKIQNQIDEMIEDLKRYSDFAQAPSYNGLFKQFPPESVRVDSIGINTYVDFNYNNLLQVVSYVCVDTNQKGLIVYGCGDYSVGKTMTFDLNTGNQINLSDLFVTGSDYVSRLNELVMLQIQNNTEEVFDDTGYYEQFGYQGGFKGIRGDVEFSLGYEGLSLIFDENYPEFFNGFRSTSIQVSYKDLKDILAIYQRFASENSLFIEKGISKRGNYLYEDPRVINVEKRDQTRIESIITRDQTLNDTYKSITQRIITDDQKRMDAAVKAKVDYVYYKMTASSVGPYLNIDRTLHDNTELNYLRVTYKPDGSPLTFSDVFRAGFDYKSLVIAKMKEIVLEHGFPDVYDYEAIFNTMNVMVLNYSDGVCAVRVFNKFQLPPDLNEGTFDVMLLLRDYPNDILIKDWAN